MPMSGRCMIFKKFHAWKNVWACIKCSSWIVKEDGQELHLTCKPNSCFFSFGRNEWHFGYKCLPFSLTWQVSRKCWSFGEEEEEEKKKKTRYLTIWSLSTIKKLDFCNIEYHIIFFNYTNFRSAMPR